MKTLKVCKFQFNFFKAPPFETLIFTKGTFVFFGHVSFRSLALRFSTPGARGERQDLCELFDGFGPIQAAKVRWVGG